MITFQWLEELNCSLCNPAAAPGLCTGGVRVSAPGGVDLSICDECLGVLDSMAYVDHHERPHAPGALQALGIDEVQRPTRVHVRRNLSRGPSQSFSHRAGLVVAIKHLGQQWRNRAEQTDRIAARCIAAGEHLESVEARLGVVSATLRMCADQATELVQPETRTAVISDYPKGEQTCATTSE